MKVISSKATFIHKLIFPIAWFGFLAFFLLSTLTSGVMEKDFLIILIVPVAMGVIGFVIMKKFIWDLMDEVTDHGDHLIVKRQGRAETILLANVMNVNTTTYQNPPRITLRLRQPCGFGDEVAFSPATGFRLNPFRKNEVAEDLIVRIDRARSRGIR